MPIDEKAMQAAYDANKCHMCGDRDVRRLIEAYEAAKEAGQPKITASFHPESDAGKARAEKGLPLDFTLSDQQPVEIARVLDESVEDVTEAIRYEIQKSSVRGCKYENAAKAAIATLDKLLGRS